MKNSFVEREYTVRTNKVDAPLLFAFLTDLHRSEFGEDNRDLVEAVFRVNPDAVLVGGDMLVVSDAYKELKYGAKGCGWYRNAVSLTRALSKSFPVYFAPGNHESQIIKPRDEEAELVFGEAGKELARALEEAGAELLVDSHMCFSPQGGGKAEIYGFDIDGDYYRKFRYARFGEDYVTEHLGRPDGRVFTIVLSHHPRYSDAVASWGADLILAGHLHGGVMRLPGVGGVLSPDPEFFPRYSDGLYRLKGREGKDCTLIVSCGLGGHTVPFRINNPPELSVIRVIPGN